VNLLDALGLFPAEGRFKVVPKLVEVPNDNVRDIVGKGWIWGFEVQYIPKDDCRCDRIKIVQIVKTVRGTPGATLDWQVDTTDEKRIENKRKGIPVPDYRDTSTGGTYPAEKANASHPIPYNRDGPFDTYDLEAIHRFEVCAFCQMDLDLEDMPVKLEFLLGCVRFTFDQKTRKVTRVNGKKVSQGFDVEAKEPSKNWDPSMNDWYSNAPSNDDEG
jgi:hypothetical protein